MSNMVLSCFIEKATINDNEQFKILYFLIKIISIWSSILIISSLLWQDRDEEITIKQQTLDAINRNGHVILKQDSLSTEDKENIGKDLETLTDRFSKVDYRSSSVSY